jgi:hypothetical protein
MCGIFGQATNNPSKINSANIKILGMINESRGKNSCGITIDGEIYHGLENEKLFTDFAKGKSFKAKKYPIVIGHTRQASVGVINHHNAHPFGFGDNNGDYEFIGVHNGTLNNHEDLAKKYNIETYPKTIEGNISSWRTKIDSEILLEILHSEKNVKVLSEYNGKAALVWTLTTEPDTIYLFSGKSIEDEGDSQTTAKEERPMNVWIESKNNFYFSSLPEALYIIGGSKENVFQIRYNTIFKVKNGDFKNAEMITVSRRKCFQDRPIKKHYGTHSSSAIDNVLNGNILKNPQLTCGYNLNDYKTPSTKDSKIFKNLNIYDDRALLNRKKYGTKVYTEKLRYYRNGHLINGIYFNINNYGLYFVGYESKDIFDCVKRNINKKFIYEVGVFRDNSDTRNGHVPFTHSAAKETRPYYFINGVMLKTMTDYNILQLQKQTNSNSFMLTAERLSHASTLPVCDLMKKQDDEKQGIYWMGKLYTGEIEGLLFEKKYIIQDGNLIDAKELKSETKLSSLDISVAKFDPKVLDKAIHNLAKLETDKMNLQNKNLFSLITTDEEEENKEVSSTEDIAEFLCEVALESFSNIDEELDNLVASIEKHKSHTYFKVIDQSIADVRLAISNYIPKK